MLRFFRTIRKIFLIENKFSKYLLYALGEIILVVIGILIALQINIRNENRKNQDLVAIYKAELRNDFELDISHFRNHAEHARTENRGIDSIRSILQNPHSTLDTLNGLIKKGLFFIPKAAYIMPASTEYPILNNNTFLSLQSSGHLAMFDNKMQEELISFFGYSRKYSFMIQEIINSKNALYYNYVRAIPVNTADGISFLNPDLDAQVWNNVDWKTAQINYVTLLNSYYELNLKTVFFNEMRLYKTNIMLDSLHVGLE